MLCETNWVSEVWLYQYMLLWSGCCVRNSCVLSQLTLAGSQVRSAVYWHYKAHLCWRSCLLYLQRELYWGMGRRAPLEWAPGSFTPPSVIHHAKRMFSDSGGQPVFLLCTKHVYWRDKTGQVTCRWSLWCHNTYNTFMFICSSHFFHVVCFIWSAKANDHYMPAVLVTLSSVLMCECIALMKVDITSDTIWFMLSNVKV